MSHIQGAKEIIPGLRGFMYKGWADKLFSMPSMMKDPSYNTPDSKASPGTSPIFFANWDQVWPNVFLLL